MNVGGQVAAILRYSGNCQISSTSSEFGLPKSGHLLLLRDLSEVIANLCTSFDTSFQLDSVSWSTFLFTLEFKYQTS